MLSLTFASYLIIAALIFLLACAARAIYLEGALIDMQVENYKDFKKLPSKQKMFWSFWVWDLNKFL